MLASAAGSSTSARRSTPVGIASEGGRFSDFLSRNTRSKIERNASSEKGLLRYSSMPACRQRSRSPTSALAVTPMTGRRGSVMDRSRSRMAAVA